MTFLYPLGLLGLIGIPILIIIYILKNKYIEQIIPSTYLWTLSERFLKRRNPLSKIAGIISLILQLLLVLVISLAIARPQLVLAGEARAYTFILDGSGSMVAVEDGKSRFDEGKEAILEIIGDSVEGSSYSLVYVGGETRVVFEDVGDKERAAKLLGDLSPVHSTVDFSGAIGVAQSYFDSNNSALTYLVTDKTYTSTRNITVVNVASEVNNLAISDVTYIKSGENVTVRGNAVSYGAAATVELSLFKDDVASAVASAEVNIPAGGSAPFSLSARVGDFYSLTVRLPGEDAISLDNEYTIFSVESANEYSALIVSDLPYFLETVLENVSSVSIKTVKASEYVPESGYDLYIFDSYTPNDIPADGAVWFVNPVASTDGTGFSVQGKYTPDEAVELQLSDSTATLVERLTDGVSGKGIYVTEYVKCGLYEQFTTLFTHMGNPVIFTGTNVYGNREVVFAFDLHESNLPLMLDYVALAGNFIGYSFPTVLDRTDYIAGEELSVNVVAGTDSIIVKSPSGSVTSLSTSGAVAEMLLSEAGVYKIELTVSGGVKDYYVFSDFPTDERAPIATGDDIGLVGEAGSEGIDGIYENYIILFIILVLLFLADWGVYCYEKHQLR